MRKLSPRLGLLACSAAALLAACVHTFSFDLPGAEITRLPPIVDSTTVAGAEVVSPGGRRFRADAIRIEKVVREDGAVVKVSPARTLNRAFARDAPVGGRYYASRGANHYVPLVIVVAGGSALALTGLGVGLNAAIHSNTDGNTKPPHWAGPTAIVAGSAVLWVPETLTCPFRKF